MNLAAMPTSVMPHYAELLTEFLPSVIQTEEQNELYLQQVTALLRREELTAAEEKLMQLLIVLIENFEEKNFNLPKASPVAALKFLIEQHELRQKDLTDVFGAPSIISEVLRGKRELTKEQIRRLSSRFGVPVTLFF